MNAAVVTDRVAEISPRAKARMAGAFYLLAMVAGVFAQTFVSERLVIPGDAVATAANVQAHQGLFRLGFTGYLVEMTCLIVTTTLFYDLLKPVSRSISLLAAILGVTACVIKTLSRLLYFAPVFILGDAHYLSVFSEAQRQALALLSLSP
ncbi:MAG: DUF4386 domain-containing protein [Gemmatimonadales bacterium]